MCVLFDFDLTQAPDSFSTPLRRRGMEDPDVWREAHVQLLVERGKEKILARVHSLVRLSRSGATSRFTTELVREAGGFGKPFEGVPEMSGALRESAAAALPGLEVDSYLITSGFSELHRAVSSAGVFANVWGTEFHFDEAGELAIPRRTATHPEKVRYVLQFSAGVGTEGPDGPADVCRDVPDERMHVPLDQVVYVGDGGSDMPVSFLLHDPGGIAPTACKADWRTTGAGSRSCAPAAACRVPRRQTTGRGSG